jgi:hypothetical protein
VGKIQGKGFVKTDELASAPNMSVKPLWLSTKKLSTAIHSV